MLTGVLMSIRRICRRLPPIAWRDRTIATQRRRIASVRKTLSTAATTNAQLQRQLTAQQRKADLLRRQPARVAQPSFNFKHHEARRIGKLLDAHDAVDPIWTVNPKHAAYEFVAGHGVRVPKILHRYPSAAEIDWADLPDEFVLKTHKGTGARGVVPLVRSGEKFRDLLGEEGLVSGDDVRAMLEQRKEAGEVSDEVFAEELLWSPYPGREGLALDIKLYCFYGVVGMIMVRNANGSRNADEIKVRYFDPDGTDLDDAMQHLALDETLPEPLFREELIGAGERLSAALSRPFVRLDFYEQADGIVFGEITPSPGGKQLARRDIDERLGGLWEDAEARLRAEAIAACALDPDARLSGRGRQALIVR